jgi:DNA invertase Pin-like site-specific DNA recombinase
MRAWAAASGDFERWLARQESPELDKALAYLREGDVLVITRLSRAMRSLKHLLALADGLRECGAGLVVLKQHVDTTTPPGRLVFHILGVIDEFQRELIIEGTREGLDAARALASRVPNAVRPRVAEQAQRNHVYLVTPVLPTPRHAAPG